jgi:hypothetical protein
MTAMGPQGKILDLGGVPWKHKRESIYMQALILNWSQAFIFELFSLFWISIANHSNSIEPYQAKIVVPIQDSRPDLPRILCSAEFVCT